VIDTSKASISTISSTVVQAMETIRGQDEFAVNGAQ
jgi:hypothetical protein